MSDSPEAQVEVCKRCKKRIFTKKDRDGRPNNKVYHAQHRRDFLQPNDKEFQREYTRDVNDYK